MNEHLDKSRNDIYVYTCRNMVEYVRGMYIDTYIYIYTHTYIYIKTQIHMHNTCTSPCSYIHLSIYPSIHLSIYLSICSIQYTYAQSGRADQVSSLGRTAPRLRCARSRHRRVGGGRGAAASSAGAREAGAKTMGPRSCRDCGLLRAPLKRIMGFL